jgi:hypothetical protein
VFKGPLKDGEASLYPAVTEGLHICRARLCLLLLLVPVWCCCEGAVFCVVFGVGRASEMRSVETVF